MAAWERRPPGSAGRTVSLMATCTQTSAFISLTLRGVLTGRMIPVSPRSRSREVKGMTVLGQAQTRGTSLQRQSRPHPHADASRR